MPQIVTLLCPMICTTSADMLPYLMLWTRSWRYADTTATPTAQALSEQLSPRLKRTLSAVRPAAIYLMTCPVPAAVYGFCKMTQALPMCVALLLLFPLTAVFTAEKYSDVYIGGTKTFRKFILTSGSERYTAGASETAYGTVEIETPFASAALAGALYNRLKDYTYKSWSCNKMLASIGQLAIIPSPSSLITFGTKQNLYVNNCTVSLTSTGIYASVGRNDADEDELAYHNRTEREIAMRVRIGALMGNTVITEKGAALVVKDEVNNKTVNYGFEMDESGVATFEGAIIDTILPTCKRTATTDGIALIADYGGKKLKYSYSEDADGNINLMRDEVNDDG